MYFLEFWSGLTLLLRSNSIYRSHPLGDGQEEVVTHLASSLLLYGGVGVRGVCVGAQVLRMEFLH